MIRINPHYQQLAAHYLFAEISRRVQQFQTRHPEREIIRLGIGDVTQPLPAACIDALHAATDDMADTNRFRGYGPEQGYDFLRDAIATHDYQARGIAVAADEIFVSDGSKCDTGNIQEIFATDIRVAIPDPVYPVYVDTNVMAGRAAGLLHLECSAANGYVPSPPDEPIDLIYLCFPNNPTGATASRAQLQAWVDYAHAQKALILFDAAYEAFIRDPALPRSIYEIPGARAVAIEFRSFSKTAGFTGLRCAYTVVPRECLGWDDAGRPVALHALWNRRHSTKFNGVSYPVQRAAAAVYSPAGQAQVRALTDYYLENARLIRAALLEIGLPCSGGENSPYVWVDCGMDAWAFFELLLQRAGVVCTPGAGFGHGGDGHVRFSAFAGRDDVRRAMQRVTDALLEGDRHAHA